jgi:predicted acylesterase/phospholipase RssA
MRILVLSGGGFRIAYHVGVLRALHDAGLAYFDLIIGTSAGALVAHIWRAAEQSPELAPDGPMEFLEQLVSTTTEAEAFTRYPWLSVALRLARGKLGIYGHRVLLETIRKRLGPDVRSGAEVCYVRVDTGEEKYAAPSPLTTWASTTIPVLWEPVVDRELEGGAPCVDGGVRKYLPLGRAMDVIAACADPGEEHEIIAVVTSPLDPGEAGPWRNIGGYGLRILGLLGNEIARANTHTHSLLNHLAEEAAGWGHVHTKLDGSPLRHVRLTTIVASEAHGDTIERDPKELQRGYELGKADAARALKARMS